GAEVPPGRYPPPATGSPEYASRITARPVGGVDRPRVAAGLRRGTAAAAGGIPSAVDFVLPGGAQPGRGGAAVWLDDRFGQRAPGARAGTAARPAGATRAGAGRRARGRRVGAGPRSCGTDVNGGGGSDRPGVGGGRGDARGQRVGEGGSAGGGGGESDGT